ncbi:MAG: hypothetical protein GF320_22430 [Armatimonadia bacterium]|nr:hypothetical protein [Armatimonadia bacterium]
MELYKIDEKGLAEAMARVMEDYRVVAPVEKGPKHVFDDIEDWSDARPMAVGTVLPPKKYAFPQRETLLRFTLTGETPEAEAVMDDTPVVMAGVHPCDIAGLRCIDHTLAGRHFDEHYGARRMNAIVFGFDCMPDEHCFCTSVGTLKAESGYDLFFTPIQTGGFVIRIGTPRGRQLFEKYFQHAEGAGVYEESLEADFRQRKAEAVTAHIDAPVDDLPEVYQESMDSEVWDKWGAVCFSCGSCSLVCPTCYCFDVQDRVSLDGSEGRRDRIWDACTLPDFATVAGGHDFRPTAPKRLIHRHNRKFNYQQERYGEPHCTGCGRCGRSCLVHINMVTVANELIAEQKGEEA